MISLLSFIIVLIGAFNWLSIGILQFDFIAGIFGSQANIFSRIVYAIIGFSAFWLIYATIRQHGKIFVNGKKENDEQLIGKLKDKLTRKKKPEQEQNSSSSEKTEAISNTSTPQPAPKTETTKNPDDTPPIKMQDSNMTVGISDDKASQNSTTSNSVTETQNTTQGKAKTEDSEI